MASAVADESVTLQSKDVRDICFREIWPELAADRAFIIESEEEAKECFLLNRVDLKLEKREECWRAIQGVLGEHFDWTNVRVTRDELEVACSHLRLQCDVPKRVKRKIPKSHRKDCNYGSLLRLMMGRKMLLLALYGQSHNLAELKLNKKDMQATKDVLAAFATLKAKYVLPGTKCTPACKQMQDALDTKIYGTCPVVETFSLLVKDDDVEEASAASDVEEDSASSQDEEVDAGDVEVAPVAFPVIASNLFKFRMRLCLQIDMDTAHDEPQSDVVQLYGNSFYVKKSTIPDAGFGLFTATDLPKGTTLLGNDLTPEERMQRFGDLMKVNENQPEFKSTPKVVDVDDEAQEDYRKQVYERESQAFVNQKWRDLAHQWNVDVHDQHGMTDAMKETLLQDPMVNHPYAIDVTVMRGYNDKGEMYLYTKFYNPFNKIWGFINGKDRGFNLQFVIGEGDDPREDYYSPTQLATVVDIPANTELFFDYGEQYNLRDTESDEESLLSEADSAGSFLPLSDGRGDNSTDMDGFYVSGDVNNDASSADDDETESEMDDIARDNRDDSQGDVDDDETESEMDD